MTSRSSSSRSSNARNSHRRDAYLELTGETPPANLRTPSTSHKSTSHASRASDTTLRPDDSTSNANSRFYTPRAERQRSTRRQQGPIIRQASIVPDFDEVEEHQIEAEWQVHRDAHPRSSRRTHNRSRATSLLPSVAEESLEERMNRLDIHRSHARHRDYDDESDASLSPTAPTNLIHQDSLISYRQTIPRLPRAPSTSSRHSHSTSQTSSRTYVNPVETASRLSRPASHIPEHYSQSQSSRLSRPASHIPEHYNDSHSQSSRLSRPASHIPPYTESHSGRSGLSRSVSVSHGSRSISRRGGDMPETRDGVRLGRSDEGRVQWERSRRRSQGNGRMPGWLYWMTT